MVLWTIIIIIIIVINIIITIIIITVRHYRVSIWLLWASACIKPTTTTTTTTTMQVGGCCCHRDHIWYRLCSALCPGTAARLYLYSKNKNKSKHLTVFMPLLIWLIGIYWLCDFLWLGCFIHQVCLTEARCSSFLNYPRCKITQETDAYLHTDKQVVCRQRPEQNANIRRGKKMIV